jgi:hypothetical protein
MKKQIKFSALLISLFILFGIAESMAQIIDPDRNMFGLYIPRGLTKTSDNLADGYVMFVPTNSASVYLMNRKGEIVHEWKGNYRINSPYLNDDGSITLSATDPDFPVFAAPGPGGRIQTISWDSNMLWDFEYATEDYITHRDISVLPNGNVLAIAWEVRSADDVIQAGRKPEFTPKVSGLWTSRIVEIKPLDRTHGEVVWKWHIWDHLIQDLDKEKDNYGDVAAHPELLDFNVLDEKLPDPISQDSLDVLLQMRKVNRNTTVDNEGSDIFHLNAIDYNADLDQIAFSSYTLNEVFIIDHSTTSEEAAGHSGGQSGKGGDFLFRWGNPQNYRQGDSTDQQTFNQHDIRWIQKGMPGEGSLTIFNNGIPGHERKDSLAYSAIYQIRPIIDDKGNYKLMENKRFAPKVPEWKYIAKDTISFYSSFISGAERMENGNTFINEGAKARFFEVTQDGEIVWEYLNQYRGNIRETNGDPVPVIPFAFSAFRANFISADHPAFKGKTLVPLDPQPEVFKLPPKKEEEKED